MKTAANQSYLHRRNKRAVLEAIFEQGPVSKAELARMLKLSKPAMADNVAPLLEMGIVQETDEERSLENMGRKPVLLGINKSRKYIVSIDFYYQKSIFCLFNLRNEVQNELVVHQSPQQGFAVWVQTAMGAIHTLLTMKKIQPSDLAAIGISSPGVIERNQSLILNEPMYGTFDPNALYSSLVSEFHCNVYINNSTNASALGEWENGKFRRAPNLVYISCGLGLGAGIITQGKLYEGSNAAAGEIANFVCPETMHTEVSLEKRICIATLLEDFARKETARTKEITKKRMGEAATFNDLISLWERGNAFMQSWVDGLSVQLGCMVCNIVMVLNCDWVIIGGEYRVFEKQLIPAIQDMVNRKCIKPAQVVVSSLGEHAASIGMATICREMYFDSICGL